MLEILKTFLISEQFIPYKHGYLWKPELVWLYVVRNSLIALTYYSIPVVLVYFVRQRRDIPFNWIFLMFSTFIFTSGTSYLLEIWALWHPNYWLLALIKAITALSSLSTAVLLVLLIPHALALPSATQLEKTNLALINEIKERKIAQDALRESEERLQAILDNSTALFYLTDTQNKVLLLNRRYEALFHINREQAIGKSLYEIWPIEIANAFVRNNQQVLEVGKPLELEEVASQDDELRTYLSIKFPLYNSSGIPYAVCSISTDITERKQIEEALYRAHDELEIRVQERTVELAKANASLHAEIAERKLAQEALHRREQELKALIENNPDMIARLDRNLRHVYVNPAVEWATGLSPHEFIGKTHQELGMPEELVSEWTNVLGEVFEIGQEKTIEFQFPTPTGLRDYLCRFIPEFAQDGSIEFVVSITRDVTERKQAEKALQQINEELELRVEERTAEILQTNELFLTEIVERRRVEVALRESEEKFRRIFNDAPIGIALARASDTQFVMVNPAFCGLLGYSESELLARSCPAISYLEDLEKEQPYAEAMFRGESNTYQMEKRYVKKNGEIFWGSLTTTAIRNQTGEVVYIFGMVKNITERKQAQEALRRAHDELELRVQERTVELAKVNASLQAEITERKRAEEALRETNQMLQTLIKVSPIAINILDLEGKVRLWNPAAEKIFGWSEQEVLGRPVPGVPKEKQREFRWFRRAVVHGNEFTGLEVHCRRKDGSAIDVTLSTAPLPDAEGNIIGAMGIFMDITERKRAEAERERLLNQLAQERSQLEAIIRQMPGGVIVAEAPSGRLLLGNQQAAQIWGLPFPHSTGIEPYEEWNGFHADGQPYQPHEWPLSRSISKGEVVMNEEIEIVRADGTRGAIMVSSTPIRVKRSYPLRAAFSVSEAVATLGAVNSAPKEQGVGNHCEKIIAGVVTFYDITERNRAEREIKELNQNLERRVAERTAELEATNRELEAFSYSVSHDLRAPLRGIDGFSQALLERYTDKLDDQGKHYLQRIRANTQRMGELIDDLLKLSRVTRSEMRRTQVDLSAIAKEIATELQQTQPSRQVEWAIAPGLVADGDARLLRVALENLLNNAWKFTSFHTCSRIEFNVILQEDTKFVYFVRDNGAGFDMANANKLFGAFHRLHSSTQFPGTGIGLATVQRIIHRHGGRVWAEGAVEQGAAFYFTL